MLFVDKYFVFSIMFLNLGESMKIRRNEIIYYANKYINSLGVLKEYYWFDWIKRYSQREVLIISESDIKKFLYRKAKEAGIDMDERLEGSGRVVLTGKESDNSLIQNLLKLCKVW